MIYFPYNCIKRKYSDWTLLFTDANSFMYQTQTDNEYKDFYVDKHLFNFSGYKKKIPFYHDKNKKVIGKMKNELNREIIEEYVSLRKKMHLKKMKKAKGVKKNIMKKALAIKTI